MAYTPTNWQDGDVITAEKMNKLEQGVAEGGGGVLLVNVTETSSTFTADKTYDEVDAAVEAGKMVYLVYNGFYIPLYLINSTSDGGGGER